MLIVDTVGFKPGVLVGRRVHDAQRAAARRRAFLARSRSGVALRREYVADDPLYFTGEFRGADTAFVADLPYEPPTCNDLSYKTGRGTLAAQPATAERSAGGQHAGAGRKPWWMFWK